MNGRESAMTTVITCHNCKRPGRKKKYCNQLNKRTDMSSDVENGKMKWCTYRRRNGHSNKDCCQQQSESANLDSRERWCTYHNSACHSNDEDFHQRGSKFENSSSIDGKNSGKQ